MGDVSLDEKAGRRGLAVFIHFQGKYGPLEQWGHLSLKISVHVMESDSCPVLFIRVILGYHVCMGARVHQEAGEKSDRGQQNNEMGKITGGH